jgi:hypothetical protein
MVSFVFFLGNNRNKVSTCDFACERERRCEVGKRGKKVTNSARMCFFFATLEALYFEPEGVQIAV